MKKLALLSLALIFVAGCSTGIVKSKVEGGIENALKDYIGPAREYVVDAAGSEMSMLNGEIKHLHIIGTDVHLDPNLIVSNMVIDLDRVRFDPSSQKLTSVDSTTFSAMITENAANDYLARTQKNDSTMTVEMQPNEVFVEFTPKFVGVDLLIKVKGKPQIVHGNKVNFVADSGSVAHLPVPSYLVNKALDLMNPIFDLSTMRFPVNLSRVSINKNNVVVEGNAVLKNVGK